jgi:nicotinamide-nucleotide amidase
VSYASPVKADVLGVDPDLIDRQGAVDPAVAVQMAIGARRILGPGPGLRGRRGTRQRGRDGLRL